MRALAFAVALAVVAAGCTSWSGEGGNEATGTSTSKPSTTAPSSTTGTSTASSSNTTSPPSTSSTSSTSATNTTTTGPAANVTLNATHIGLRALSGLRSPSCGVVRVGTNCHLVSLRVWSNITKDVDVSAGRWMATTASNRQQAPISSDRLLVAAGTNATVLLKWPVTDEQNDDPIATLHYTSPAFNATIPVRAYSTARMPVPDGGALVTSLRLSCHAAYFACPMPSNHPNDIAVAGIAGDASDPSAVQHAFNGTLRVTVSARVYNVSDPTPYPQLLSFETPIYTESTTGTNPLQSLLQIPAVTIQTGLEYRIHVRATLAATGAVVEATHSWHY